MLILTPMGPFMTVFSLDGTEGTELPDELNRFATFEGRWDPARLGRLIENARRHRIRMDFRPLSSTNAGFVRETLETDREKLRIVIHEEMDERSTFAVLCREMAHVLLGHLCNDENRWWPARSHLGRSAIEIEAETSAYIVTRRRGLEGTSAEYMSRHLHYDGTVPTGVSFDTIAKAARKIERMALWLFTPPRSRRHRRKPVLRCVGW